MRFSVIYAPEVFDDIQEAVNWYNFKQKGLGTRFFNAIKEQIKRIKRMPSAFPVIYDDVRCAQVNIFPYMIHFRLFPEKKTIHVIAIFSTDRDPKIWKERTEK